MLLINTEERLKVLTTKAKGRTKATTTSCVRPILTWKSICERTWRMQPQNCNTPPRYKNLFWIQNGVCFEKLF